MKTVVGLGYRYESPDMTPETIFERERG